MSEPTPVEATLSQREALYGSFADSAHLAQGIKRAMARGTNWPRLDADHREALEMIATKIARILNGDAGVADSWHDIAGYARLVEKRLTSEAGAAEAS